MIKTYTIFFKITFFTVLISLTVLLVNNFYVRKKDIKIKEYELVVLQEDSTWIYEITLDNKLLIKQNTIPVISGNKKFISKQDAEKIGTLVLNKLKRRKNPIISYDDLLKNNIKIY